MLILYMRKISFYNPIDDIIKKYTFNFCRSCNNQLSTWEEKIRIRRFYFRFICHQCRVNKNLQNPKVRKLRGI